MPRPDAYFLRQTGGFLSKGDGLMGDFYLASVGEFSRAPKVNRGLMGIVFGTCAMRTAVILVWKRTCRRGAGDAEAIADGEGRGHAPCW